MIISWEYIYLIIPKNGLNCVPFEPMLFLSQWTFLLQLTSSVNFNFFPVMHMAVFSLKKFYWNSWSNKNSRRCLFLKFKHICKIIETARGFWFRWADQPNVYCSVFLPCNVLEHYISLSIYKPLFCIFFLLHAKKSNIPSLFRKLILQESCKTSQNRARLFIILRN